MIGHPFNPPHIMPLVEVVGGKQTSEETIERAMAFYRAIGKQPIRLRKEVVGHVANRLQAALYREVVYLIEQGVVNVADADNAVSWGPGLRWGVMGPNLLFHLGGGEGGIKHFMEHLSGPVATWWKDLGALTDFTPQIKQTLVDGVLKEAGGRYDRPARRAARRGPVGTVAAAKQGRGAVGACEKARPRRLNEPRQCPRLPAVKANVTQLPLFRKVQI